jgi:hypothetical protein
MRLGPVAQSVEQRIENPCVGGSIPPQATITTRKGKRKPAIQKIAGFFTPVVFGFIPALCRHQYRILYRVATMHPSVQIFVANPSLMHPASGDAHIISDCVTVGNGTK